jgi:hypothetical protein
MRDEPEVRRFRPDEWRAYRDLRLRSLADAPDAFGSTLERECDLPHAHWSERLASPTDGARTLPLAAERGGEVAGLAFGRIAPDTPGVANVYQI